MTKKSISANFSSAHFAYLPIIQNYISDSWNRGVRIWNDHSDLINSTGILAVTTCLFAEKIFRNFPQAIPRIGRVILNYIGIISLNVQVRDCLKSWSDFSRSLRDNTFDAMVQTGARVFVKGVNALLTAVYFTASVAALCSFPQIASGIYLVTRSISLTSLALGILGDVWDYHVNEEILHGLHLIEDGPHASRQIAKTMINYFKVIFNVETSRQLRESDEYRLAARLVRQLDYQTIQSFQKNLGTIPPTGVRAESIRLFGAVKQSLLNKQSWTKSNLSLLVLGYLSMGLCRAYPDSLVEMSARWGMSVLYNDEFIRYKLFQADVTRLLSQK